LLTPPAVATITILKWALCGGGCGVGGRSFVVIGNEALVEEALLIVSD
jgi:hypothetical protein